MLKVIGHKAPDTDTVCSAISYAWFLNQKGKEAKAFRAGDLNKETAFVLQKFGIQEPEILERFLEKDEIVIVDTNNKEELLEGIDQAQIKEIIDHHKLTGTLATSEPISVIIKPWASTASIIWKHMKHSEVEMSKEIAGLLLAAILSDTLKFTSPTTTGRDKQSADELARIAGVDIDSFADEMFTAKSDLSGMSAKDLLLVDSKVFDFGENKTRISVLETTKPENALAMTKDLIKQASELKKSESLKYLFFFVVDILKSESTLIVVSDAEKEISKKAFGREGKGSTIQLPEVVSRKKQMVPNLEEAITG